MSTVIVKNLTFIFIVILYIQRRELNKNNYRENKKVLTLNINSDNI